MLRCRSSHAAGNEANVETYINFTGLLWELGEEMGALLIFAEVITTSFSYSALYKERYATFGQLANVSRAHVHSCVVLLQHRYYGKSQPFGEFRHDLICRLSLVVSVPAIIGGMTSRLGCNQYFFSLQGRAVWKRIPHICPSSKLSRTLLLSFTM